MYAICVCYVETHNERLYVTANCYKCFRGWFNIPAAQYFGVRVFRYSQKKKKRKKFPSYRGKTFLLLIFESCSPKKVERFWMTWQPFRKHIHGQFLFINSQRAYGLKRNQFRFFFVPFLFPTRFTNHFSFFSSFR